MARGKSSAQNGMLILSLLPKKFQFIISLLQQVAIDELVDGDSQGRFDTEKPQKFHCQDPTSQTGWLRLGI